MAKAKYKLGQFVEVRKVQGEPSRHGVIDAVVTAKDGFLYALQGDELNAALPEACVLNAYRPVVNRPRKPREPKKTAPTKK